MNSLPQRSAEHPGVLPGRWFAAIAWAGRHVVGVLALGVLLSGLLAMHTYGHVESHRSVASGTSHPLDHAAVAPVSMTGAVPEFAAPRYPGSGHDAAMVVLVCAAILAATGMIIASTSTITDRHPWSAPTGRLLTTVARARAPTPNEVSLAALMTLRI